MRNLKPFNQVTYRFNDLEVDLRRQEVRRDGIVVPAQRKVFDLLAYLIENRSRAVDTLELQQAVWFGTTVCDANLKVCIAKVRRLVGDDSAQQAIIKTIRAYGYRFVATLAGPAEGEEAVLETALTANYQEALKATETLSVAVLPFQDFGKDPEQAYFSEGITDDIITELSRHSSLFVTSPQTARRLSDSPDEARSLAQTLGIAFTVQGSIRRSESRIRVSVHLIDTDSDRRIWSESYDRLLEDIPMIHDDVSRRIALTIGARVEAHRARQPFDSAGVKVYDSILRAKSLHSKDSKAENAEARAILEQVIAIAPDNALAYTWLAMVHAHDSWSRWSADPEQSIRLAVEFSSKALAIDDSKSVIHCNYAEIMGGVGEVEVAERHYIRALELNPSDAVCRSFYATLLVSDGRREEALQQLAVANRQDPLGHTWTAYANGFVMCVLGRYSEAIEWLSKLTNTDNVALLWLATALSKEGELDRARSVLEQFLKTAQEDMESIPGNDEESWLDYIRLHLLFEGKRDFKDSYDALLKAGWRELVNALPGLQDGDGQNGESRTIL